MKQELERRTSHTQQVLALFRARPQQWIAWRELAKVGGQLAWRTRVAEARRILKRDGGSVEWNKNIRASAYRFVPYERLGRDAADHVTQKALF